jgi:predicted nucleic-acid-binding protein
MKGSIGIDTNVLVRYIAQDDTQQSSIATRFIEKNCTAETPGFLSLVVIVELVWVMESRYEASREDVVTALSQLLRAKQLIVDDAETVWQAIRAFAAGKADFADCLIERLCHNRGCTGVVTFDKAAAKSGMALLVK